MRRINWFRLLRTIHSWLGFFVMPWILVIGLTGIYLNHGRMIYAWLPNGTYDESAFDQSPAARPVDASASQMIASAVWPDATFKLTTGKKYHKREAFILKGGDGHVIVDAATGHYWVKTRFLRRTFDPDGRLLNRKVYWGRIFNTLHRTGWVNRGLGTWLADITAGAMVVFGLSGMYLFLSPRLRRWRNRSKRGAQSASVAIPQPRRISSRS